MTLDVLAHVSCMMCSLRWRVRWRLGAGEEPGGPPIGAGCACELLLRGTARRQTWVVLRWEKQSRGRCQCDAVGDVWECRRTLGGIRVERPRFWIKLILTAGWRSISINCCFSGNCSCAGDAPGLARQWRGDGGSTVRLCRTLRVSAGAAKMVADPSSHAGGHDGWS